MKESSVTEAAESPGSGAKPYKVTVVGIGDDGPQSLTPAALRVVSQAELVCGGQRHLAFFPDHPARKLVLKGDLNQALEVIDEARRTQRVVVLASGDPLFFGIGSTLVSRFGPEAVEILPNVSSMQLAFARVGESWQDAMFLSAHGQPLENLLRQVWRARKIAILTDEKNTPSLIAQRLLQAGMENCRAVVGEHLGGKEERLVKTDLQGLVGMEFSALNILLLFRDKTRGLSFRLGLPDDVYSHREGQITKAEVRAVSLSKLALKPRDILWDIGAGCGSVSIEAASFLTEGWAYAVERDPQQLALLEENRRRFQALNLQVIAGPAPQVLDSLPHPNAVFIGGSGGDLEGILKAVQTRLLPGGRVVMNLVTLENLHLAQRFFKDIGWDLEVTQLSVARGAQVRGLTRLAALNPVFVLRAGPGPQDPGGYGQ